MVRNFAVRAAAVLMFRPARMAAATAAVVVFRPAAIVLGFVGVPAATTVFVLVLMPVSVSTAFVFFGTLFGLVFVSAAVGADVLFIFFFHFRIYFKVLRLSLINI